ncbi:MAG: hypothetical protein R2881_02835 [Eubacteriales bacterium]
MTCLFLEPPYIFGAQKGRKPVWVFLVEMLLGIKGAILYPRGGTTMVTPSRSARLRPLERGRGANAYPIGWFNSLGEMIAVEGQVYGRTGRNESSPFRIFCLP